MSPVIVHSSIQPQSGELIDLDLRGKRSVVTGGSRGVGRAVAVLLARCGADVGIGYRSDRSSAARTVDEIEKAGSRAWAQAGDLANASTGATLCERALKEFGGLDVLVVNAGIWEPDPAPLEALPEAQWRATLDVNLTATYLILRAAIPHLSDSGRIVLITSTAGQRGEAYHADYAASKGGMVALAKSVAVEVADRGITVNCVAPGWVDTDMVATTLQSPLREGIEKEIPLGRVASADDIAGPVVFLCSSWARHITGEVVNVNGGSVLCG